MDGTERVGRAVAVLLVNVVVVLCRRVVSVGLQWSPGAVETHLEVLPFGGIEQAAPRADRAEVLRIEPAQLVPRSVLATGRTELHDEVHTCIKLSVSELVSLAPGASELSRAVMGGEKVLSQVVSGVDADGAFGQLLLSSAAHVVSECVASPTVKAHCRCSAVVRSAATLARPRWAHAGSVVDDDRRRDNAFGPTESGGPVGRRIDDALARVGPDKGLNEAGQGEDEVPVVGLLSGFVALLRPEGVEVVVAESVPFARVSRTFMRQEASRARTDWYDGTKDSWGAKDAAVLSLATDAAILVPEEAVGKRAPCRWSKLTCRHV